MQDRPRHICLPSILLYKRLIHDKLRGSLMTVRLAFLYMKPFAIYVLSTLIRQILREVNVRAFHKLEIN